MGKRLCIVGAGPKAMAIAAKNRVLADLGFRVPEIHIIERSGVGANWTGQSGFTNGKIPLGTSPEKDIGFPYASKTWGSFDERVDWKMKEFSWNSYLIGRGLLSEWIDRGRPAPLHREWADYLRWVYERVSDGTHFHWGNVVGIDLRDGRWVVRYEATGRPAVLECDGLVLTGPGNSRLLDQVPVHDRILDVENFWKRYKQFRRLDRADIALVGCGENAAAIAMALAENEALQVSVLSPSGFVYSRGESHLENRVYTDPSHASWSALTDADKREFIQRTDRGVFSQHAQSILNRSSRIQIYPGKLESLRVSDGRLEILQDYNGASVARTFDYVVMAAGSDHLGFLSGLLTPAAKARLQVGGVDRLEESRVERTIGEDLALSELTPKLHLPMLSGLAVGPGFANLSCLGRLSDHILRSYVEVKS